MIKDKYESPFCSRYASNEMLYIFSFSFFTVGLNYIVTVNVKDLTVKYEIFGFCFFFKIHIT